MPARNITDKQLRQLASWEKFVVDQLGAYPSTIAAIKLGMTSTGVYNAAERGFLAFFQVGRCRWYGRRDVIQYRHSVSRKFRDNRIQPAKFPKNLSPRDEEIYLDADSDSVSSIG